MLGAQPWRDDDRRHPAEVLAKALAGEQLEREALYWHYPHYSNQGGKPGAAIRAGDYKLLEFFEEGRQELFNVKTDQGESQNLIATKPEIAKDLANKLHAWQKSVNAQMMKPNPDYIPNPQAADGTITLPGKTAVVHGVQLRFEPLPHKNTLGFWTKLDDWAEWEFQVSKPGEFTLEILQGCGKGSGGSEVLRSHTPSPRPLRSGKCQGLYASS